MALARSSHRKSYHSTSWGHENYEFDHPFLISPPSPPAPIGRKIQSNKWYKEPKIPIHMNMSTMIRMKSKESKPTEGEGQMALYGNENRKPSTFSPARSNRRMFDYMQEKFEIIKDESFVGSTYTKNLFWGMVAEHESRHNISANPCGDGFPKRGTYHRVSAFNVQAASGCNLQYIEKISIHSKTKSSESKGQQIRASSSNCVEKLKNLSISKDDQGCGESNREYRGGKKKAKKSSKKPVVVTCLKNTSIKYVKK